MELVVRDEASAAVHRRIVEEYADRGHTLLAKGAGKLDDAVLARRMTGLALRTSKSLA